jgi:ribosomal protein S18 acetylase RimI-like enzyme
VRVVTLAVYEHNHSARRLYGTLGFRDTGQPTESDVDGETWTSIEMELPVA